MKLAEYIEKLKELLEEHGDLDLIYSTDDEGNRFDKVNYSPTVIYAEEDGYHYSIRNEEDFEKVVCVN